MPWLSCTARLILTTLARKHILYIYYILYISVHLCVYGRSVSLRVGDIVVVTGGFVRVRVRVSIGIRVRISVRLGFRVTAKGQKVKDQ